MVPRKVGAAWEVQAPAKLNLYLEVLGRRADGFHELETLLVPVQVYDHLRWSPVPSPRSGLRLSIHSQFDNVVDQDSSDNLVLRAAKLLAERAGIEPHGHFELTKRIPLQAGLGGGSSDAAAALLLANAAWQTGFDSAGLTALAAELGSDVPFFLTWGPAIARGRGELVESVGHLPRLDVILVKPLLGMSTPTIFRDLNETAAPTDARRVQSARVLADLLSSLRAGAIGRAGDQFYNRLEKVAVKVAPEISRIKRALAQAGCWGQFMTGSGSTVVGIARSAIHARRMAQSLAAQNFGTVLATATGG